MTGVVEQHSIIGHRHFLVIYIKAYYVWLAVGPSMQLVKGGRVVSLRPAGVS